MEKQTKESIVQAVQQFSLPSFHEIPNVGLYLEQTAKYVSEYLSPLGDFALTGSMISNYVKKGLIPSPVRKLYNREQIAYLIFIALTKSIISIDDLRLFIQLQKQTYTTQVAYDYFRSELQNVLLYIFGLKDTLETVGKDSTEEKYLLRNAIVAVAHKVYVNKAFELLHQYQREILSP